MSTTQLSLYRRISYKFYRLFKKIQAPVDRTRDLKRAYTGLVTKMKMTLPLDEAMSQAVGGADDVVGPIEVAVLRHAGLLADQHLIDVGCGSGRLAVPLSGYLTGRYSGFDVVADLVDYARAKVQRPDWRFQTIDHIGIPEPDGCADMVCFFSVLTHLLHEQSYWYLEEAIRVLKPGGRIVASFLEFSESSHWRVFMNTLSDTKTGPSGPMNVFLSRDIFAVWAQHLHLEIVEFIGAQDAVPGASPLGQSVCILQKS
jgi:SAM-dependent methyltransferase